MITPEQLEQQRQSETSNAKLKLNLAGQNTVDVNEIQKGTPESLKAQGSAKLPFIIYALGSQIKTIIQPSLDNLIKQYVEKYITQGVCLTPAELTLLRQQRDLIVDQLNSIGTKIDQTGKAVTGISFFLDTLLGLITTLDIATLATSLASKFIPSPPGVPGAIPSFLNDAQTLIRKTTFDQYGNSKLSKFQTTLSSSALVLSIISGYVLTAVELLKSIDSVLTTCEPNNSLPPINPSINSIASSQLQAQQTLNQTAYNGFIIEIEEIPYTPTVNRRRAIGKNVEGIILIQTELSFTTNDQTLINELKLIIDRDNLKAY
jgi:hypothetical protein